MIRVLRPIVLLIFLAILSACGMDKNANTTVEEGRVTGPFVVNVSDGDPVSQPTFDWSEGLSRDAMDLVVAETSASNVPVWEIRSSVPSEDAIKSPLQYGTVDISVSEFVKTQSDLKTDVWYTVTVRRTSGNSGTREFRIKP
jgi:hypothetical protein